MYKSLLQLEGTNYAEREGLGYGGRRGNVIGQIGRDHQGQMGRRECQGEVAANNPVLGQLLLTTGVS